MTLFDASDVPQSLLTMSAGGEFELIDWIRAHVAANPRLSIGIGDDAAALRIPAESECLVAADMLLEGVHFTIPPAGPEQIGRKALGVNLSDIAAMAGRPLAAFVSVALPRRCGNEFARRLHTGLQELAEEFETAVAGGDTNVWDGPLVVNVAILGEAAGRGAVRRSGARVGDWIMVTGSLGGSLGGRHLSFTPRVKEALALHAAVSLHAMIDLSDGLASDLPHVLRESGVGAVLQAAAVPVADEVSHARDERTPLQHALGDGEDFELLFTVSPEEGRRLLQNPPTGIDLSHIGEIVAGEGCEIVDEDGNRGPLPPAGWQHAF